MNTTGRKFGGRQKSTPNKTTAQTKVIVEKVISNEIDNLPALLAKLTAKDRVNALIKLLPFVMPKQAEISIDTPVHQFLPIALTIAQETLKIGENG